MRTNTTRKMIIMAGLVLLLICAAGIFTACNLESPYIERIREQVLVDLGLQDQFLHSVLYDGNGNSGGLVPVDENQYEEGTEAVVLGNTNGLTKDGYTFSAWNTAADGSGTAFAEGDTFIVGAADVILFAQWAEKLFSVTFNSNGGSDVDPQTVQEGGKVTRPQDPTKAGEYFAGWFKDEALTASWVFTSDTVISDMILYAKWSLIPIYTVTFESNEGTSVEAQSVMEGEKASEPIPAPTRTGYSFSGWYKEEELNTLWDFNSDTVNNATTLWAGWTAHTTNVTLNPEGGSGGTANVTATFGSAMPSGKTAPTKTGYDFEGYYTLANGSGVKYYNSNMSSATNWAIDSATATLRANWTPKTYDVTLNMQGGSGDDTSITATYNAAMPVADAPTKKAFAFGGYFTEADGAGTQYYTETMTSAKNWTETTIDELFANWSRWTSLLGQSGTLAICQDIEIDSSGNIYAGGYANNNLGGQGDNGFLDVAVSKFTTGGKHLWTRLSGYGGKSTLGAGIAVDDSNGNSYVTGHTDGNLNGQTRTGNEDVFIIKYDTNGNRLWTRLAGATGADTKGAGVAVDGSGNTYVSGWTDGNLGGTTLNGTNDAFIIKYDTNGIKQWTKLLGVSGKYTSSRAIAVDGGGNSYITGKTYGNLDGETLNGYVDAFIVKYDSSGNKIWTRLFGVPGGSKVTQGYGITVDGMNCYVTGSTNGNLGGESLTGTYDAFVVKYTANGNYEWTRLFGTANGSKMTVGHDIAIDSSGYAVYITGYTEGDHGSELLTGTADVFAAKVRNTGSKHWIKLLGASGVDTYGYGIDIDSSDNTYVGGYTHGDLDGQTMAGSPDIFVTTKLYSSW